MGTPAASWEKTFPYRDTRIVVERLPQACRVRLGGRQAQARTLVSAFEALLDHPASDAEMAVVLAALAHNPPAGSRRRRQPRG
jgi:hypothetical protein